LLPFQISRQSAIVLTLAMTAAYAFADFTVPGQITVAILYASSVVASGWSHSPRFVWFTTFLSIILTYTGLAFGPQPPEGDLNDFYINRAFVAVGLIIIAAIVHQRMQMVEHIERVHDVQMLQNEQLLQAHEELGHINQKLEERVRQEVDRRIDIERSLNQAQKMEAIGQLTGGIAHDFNNMLAVIMANLTMIRARCAEADPSRRLADNALLGAQQAASFTKQLLGFARRQRVEPGVVEIKDVLDDVLSLTRHVVPNSIELSLDAGADVWHAYVDPAQLQSALLNLVINARDAMPDGGQIKIAAQNASVGAAVDLADGDYVRLSVSDTGCGMSPEVLGHAFEPLFTTKGAGKGTGLGLSMVYGFTKKSGGIARIESAPGCGTTVDLYLPRTDKLAGTGTIPIGREPDRPSPTA
jgi:signal transduction histidine kinase